MANHNTVDTSLGIDTAPDPLEAVTSIGFTREQAVLRGLKIASKHHISVRPSLSGEEEAERKRVLDSVRSSL